MLKKGWRPAGRTLVLAVTDDSRTTLIAVPIQGGEAVPILELTEMRHTQVIISLPHQLVHQQIAVAVEQN